MKKENKEKYAKHFGLWIKCLESNKVDSLEKLYDKVHAAIRANPDKVKKVRKDKPKYKIIDPKKMII